MDLLELIIEFHKDNERQGPGSDEATLKALSYIPLMNEKTKILDIGCGTGGQTLILANNTAAQITAVDMLPQFLETLMKKAKENNLLGVSPTFPTKYELRKTKTASKLLNIKL